MNALIRKSGLPNAKGLKIPISTRLNICLFKEMAKVSGNKRDRETVAFLEFGWPLGHDGRKPPREPKKNHKGANEFEAELLRYLETEIEKGRVSGPHDLPIFEGVNGISPLNSVKKKDSNLRRWILDLSFPKGRGINSGIDKDVYLGEEVRLKYPTVDDLVRLIFKKKEQCDEKILLWKRDLKSCYRQWPLCPGSSHLVGYKVRGKYYYDRVLAMGSTSSAQICQRITTFIARIFHDITEQEVKNFLDDFGSASVESEAQNNFDEFGILLDRLGVEESKEKACPPATQMNFLGIWFDTESMTLRLADDKVEEIRGELREWLHKSSCSLIEMQSLIGKLNFASSVVRAGRVFMARLINTLKNKKSNQSCRINLGENIRSDIRWWIEHVSLNSGVAMMVNQKWEKVDSAWSSDSSESGIGAWTKKGALFFHLELPEDWVSMDINAKECLALMVAARKWIRLFRGKRILVQCDNQSTVCVINSGVAHQTFLQACLREIYHICGLHSTEIRALWIKSVDNGLADCLSRWHLGKKYQERFYKLSEGFNLAEIMVTSQDLCFNFTSI